MHFHRRPETEQFECAIDFKTGQQKDDDQQRLQPMPQPFEARIQIYIFHFSVVGGHALIFLSALAVISAKKPSQGMNKDPEQTGQNRSPSGKI